MDAEDKILVDLHNQFAKNQNHHQALFIRFLVALLALFSGFGYIYTHTNPNITYTQSYIQKINEIDYFSNKILLVASVIVLAVLSLLNAILLNQGYGFRRDQHIITNIRKKYLEEEYKDIFGEEYNPYSKNKCTFLPNFHTIFFWFIVGFQFLVLAVICSKENLICFPEKDFSLIFFIVDILLFVLSFIFYCMTYYKYSSRLKRER